MKKVIIIGGGPSGLYCALKLLQNNFEVIMYDQSSSLGKKFLVAGNGGLNLTHSENLDSFIKKYNDQENVMGRYIKNFSPIDLLSFCHELEVDTFLGTSGRMFPTQFKAATLLSKWIKKIKSSENFKLFLKHTFVAFTKTNKITIYNQSDNLNINVEGDYVIFALGGGSWKKTGSDGKWVIPFLEKGIEVKSLYPLNCGFNYNWSSYFIGNVVRLPLKNIRILVNDNSLLGEIMITEYGVEGGAIYHLSKFIYNDILDKGSADIIIDLFPHLSLKELTDKIGRRKSKETLSKSLKRILKVNKNTFIFLKEVIPNIQSLSNEELCFSLKKVVIKVETSRPMDEAISTGGGIKFSELNKELELKNNKEIYICGEMLDFDAPTGGYLLQGCFSTANQVVKSICEKENKNQ